MGYYIEVANNHNKAYQLIEQYDARPFDGTYDDVPSDKTLVCVVDNGLFEAIGIIYDEAEYQAFSDPSDRRPRTWLVLDREVAISLNPRYGQRVSS